MWEIMRLQKKGTKPKKSLVYIISVVIIIFLMALPHIIDNYMLHTVITSIIFVTLAISWNMMLNTGQINLAHITFFGIGSYATALMYDKFHLFPIINMIVGGVAAVVLALIIGSITLRMRGIYFAIATLSMVPAMMVVITMTPKITYGSMGIALTPLFGGNRIPTYYFALAIALAALLVSYLVKKSKLNYAFVAIREDEDAAKMIGVNTTRYKIIAFILSSFFTGVVGGFYAYYMNYIEPRTVFNVAMQLRTQVMVIFGGIYSILGPVVGAVSLSFLQEYLRQFLPTGNELIYGIFLVIMILFLPKGVAGFIEKITGWDI